MFMRLFPLFPVFPTKKNKCARTQTQTAWQKRHW